MTDQKTMFIEGDWLDKMMSGLAADGYEIHAPVKDGDGTRLGHCESKDSVVLDEINTKRPMKEVFFPPTETLLEFEIKSSSDVDFAPTEAPTRKLAVLGGRPCDAAAAEVMDQVFNWDYSDAFYSSRRDSSMVVTVGCSTSDNKCFCTSVGLAPDGTAGSDMLVQPVEGKGALVTTCSEKGQAFAEAHGDMFSTAPDGVSATVAEVSPKFDVDKVKPWLDENFESPFWDDIALKCLGCGACSYLCPTCHCFDVVDESNWQAGERRRNYDCCSYALFTLHASGHNPRPTPSTRCRNRLMHKFKYFVEKFDRRACVGCGRCMRVCGVGQDIVEILADIAESEVPVESES